MTLNGFVGRKLKSGLWFTKVLGVRSGDYLTADCVVYILYLRAERMWPTLGLSLMSIKRLFVWSTLRAESVS
jgi:hypothetical protein